MHVDEFFGPWEREISSFDEVANAITRIFERWIEDHDRVFVWRGAVDASHPLHSSLYRRLLWSSPTGFTPAESHLHSAEGEVLTSVHQWGLHDGERGRLSILSQLATLQHFGAPTRLIDVTLNAYIGLWFAVQPVIRDGLPTDSEIDGRLFAIDVTRRLINEDPARRRWADDLRRPWGESRHVSAPEWTRQTWAWRPPAFERRIAAQHGAFLLGGVPRTGQDLIWPKTTGAGGGNWNQDEVRRCTSVPLRFHKVQPLAGGVGSDGQPAYTFRIKACAKREIRERLRTLFGYEHATIYPDYPGFAEFARPHLRRMPS